MKEVGERYKLMTDEERNHTLDFIIDASEASQLYYLYNKLNNLLKRDFLALLPHELTNHLLFYLDVRTLLVCCYVSKVWNDVVNNCETRWKCACFENGFLPRNPPKHKRYKDLWLRSNAVIHKLKSGSALEEILLFGHTDRVMAIYYRDGKIATGSDDHCVRLWDCHTAQCIMILQTHTVADLKFDDDRLFTGSFDTTAAAWDLHSGQLLQRYQGHVAAVFSIDYTNELIVTGSADSTVRIWNQVTGSMLKVLSQHRSAWITGVKCWRLLDGDYVVLSRDNVAVHSWVLTAVGDTINVQRHEELTVLQSDLVPGICVKESKVVYAAFCPSTRCCSVVETNVKNQIETIRGEEKNKMAAHEEKIEIAAYQERCMYKFSTDAHVQAFLGSGLQFSVFLMEENEHCPRLDILMKKEKLASINISPLYRRSKRGSTFTLGDTHWLNGFDGENSCGVLFAASLKDHSVYVLRWKNCITSDEL